MSNATNTEKMAGDGTVVATVNVDYDWIHHIIYNYNSAFEDIRFSESQLQAISVSLGDMVAEYMCEAIRDKGEELLEDIKNTLAHVDDEHEELNRLD